VPRPRVPRDEPRAYWRRAGWRLPPRHGLRKRMDAVHRHHPRSGPELHHGRRHDPRRPAPDGRLLPRPWRSLRRAGARSGEGAAARARAERPPQGDRPRVVWGPRRDGLSAHREQARVPVCGPDAARAGVALADALEVAVLAAVIDHRRDAAVVGAIDHGAEQQPVIAGVDSLVERAHRVRGRVAFEDRAALTGRRSGPRDALELVRDLGGHAARDCVASRGEEVRGEPFVCITAGRVFADFAMHTSASRGSSDTGEKAVTVSPRGRPSSPKAVTMTTPAGSAAMISR